MTDLTKFILKVLQFVVEKGIPILSRLAGRIIESLIQEPQTPQQVVQASLSAERNQPTKTTPTNPIESTPTAKKALGGSSDNAIEAQEMLLRHVERNFADSRRRLEVKIERINSQQTTVFRFILASGVIGVVFIVGGAVMLFFWQSYVVGSIVELVGLLAGGGSALFRALNSDLRRKLEATEEQQKRQTEYLRAIQTALALNGPEREKQLAETAQWLRAIASNEA